VANPEQFAKNMKAYEHIIGKNATLLVRTAALAIDQAVVLATPVDTGRARANWLVSVDGPAQKEIPAYAPGKGGSTGAANAQAAIQQGQQTVARYTESNKAIHITNNLPYIQRLNEGWSAQAPAKFIEQAIDAGLKAIRKMSLLRKR
jgi:hypothetical protein